MGFVTCDIQFASFWVWIESHTENQGNKNCYYLNTYQNHLSSEMGFLDTYFKNLFQIHLQQKTILMYMNWKLLNFSYLLFMKQTASDTIPIKTNNTSMAISTLLTYETFSISESTSPMAAMAAIARAPIIIPTT